MSRYQIVIKSLSNRYKLHRVFTLKPLDSIRYDGAVPRKREKKGFLRMRSFNLPNCVSAEVTKADVGRWLRLKTNLNKSVIVAVITCTLVITQGNTYAVAASATDHYKLYLHSRVVSEKQYKCAYYVAHIESRWNYKSSNGSHYGIFQMRNGKVKYMNAYQQIDLWLKYVAHRYDNTPCKAMSHLKIKGWQ